MGYRSQASRSTVLTKYTGCSMRVVWVWQHWLPREARQGPCGGLPVEESRQGELWQARQKRLFPHREAEVLELQDASWGGQALLLPPPGRRSWIAG